MIVSTTAAILPCEDCTQVNFFVVSDTRATGYLDCAPACIAVRYEQDPQPHLTYYPPLRLPADFDAGCEFFDACLDEGDERWFDFEFTEATGSVGLRRDLACTDPHIIDAALADARVFFEGCWPWLEETVARCGGRRTARRFWNRMLRMLMEV